MKLIIVILAFVVLGSVMIKNEVDKAEEWDDEIRNEPNYCWNCRRTLDWSEEDD